MGDRKFSPLLSSTGSKGSNSPLLSAIQNARLLTSVGQEQGIVSHLRATQPQERQDIESLLRAKQVDETLHALERAYALESYSNLLANTLNRPILFPSSLTSRLAMAALVASPRINQWPDALSAVSPPAQTTATRTAIRPLSTPKQDPKPRSTTRSPKVLFMDCDEESLSEYQCLIRQQMELFEATEDDAASSVQGRNKQILHGQVGIRCRHCAPRRTKGSMYFPTKLDRIYQAAQNLSAFHLCGGCPYVPEDVRKRILVLRERKSPAGGGKRYWAEGVRCLGVKEEKGGLLFESK